MDLFGPAFTAYVNTRFAKLHPDRDVALLSPGVRDERV